MKFDWNTFGADLRTYREKRGLGLRECSRSMPVNKSTWCRAENGKRIDVPHFVFLCEWMRRKPSNYAVSSPRPR